MNKDYEDQFRSKLDADDEAFLKDLEGDTGLFLQMGATFSGPMKYWVGFAFVLSIAFAGLALWGLYEMLRAETVKTTILWGALFIAGLLSLSMIKIWFWLRMNHLVVLKELKLIQLSILRHHSEDDTSTS